jgi:D-alanyl-D-alanine carboxypeptidase
VAAPADSLPYQAILEAQRTALQIPGATAAVIDADGRAWCGSSGVAGTDRDATCTDAFEIGSITKTFTAALVCTLAAQGMLSLDDSLMRWLPDFPHAAGVCVRHLLQHTSGLYNYSENPEYLPALQNQMLRAWTPDESFAFMREPYFAPGAGFHYSNANYVLLGIVCERVTGKTFHAALRQHVLEPHGLKSTFFLPHETPPRLAHAYIDIDQDGTPDDVTALVTLTGFITAAWSAGAVASTAPDLARWVRAYAGSDSGAATMPWVDRGDGSFYGFGLIRKTHAGTTVLGHRGASAGFSASAWHAADARVTVAVLTNGHLTDVDPIALALLDAALADEP